MDAEKFAVMRAAVLAELPGNGPGLTLAELQARVLRRLPPTLFPQAAKAGWWMKAVQLDLETKGIIARAPAAPVRLHRV